MLDRRDLTTDIAFSVLSVPVTVARPWPDDTPITTTGIWVAMPPVGFPVTDVQRRETTRVLALRRATVPTVPRGTVITAAEVAGVAAGRWRVDSVDFQDAAQTRVLVVSEPEPAVE